MDINKILKDGTFSFFDEEHFAKKNYLKIFNMVVTWPCERSTAIFDVIILIGRK